MESKRKELTSLKDIKFFVDDFYDKVRTDQILKDVFNNRIGDKWPEHFDKMYRFGRLFCWESILIMEVHSCLMQSWL